MHLDETLSDVGAKDTFEGNGFWSHHRHVDTPADHVGRRLGADEARPYHNGLLCPGYRLAKLLPFREGAQDKNSRLVRPGDREMLGSRAGREDKKVPGDLRAVVENDALCRRLDLGRAATGQKLYLHFVVEGGGAYR